MSPELELLYKKYDYLINNQGDYLGALEVAKAIVALAEALRDRSPEGVEAWLKSVYNLADIAKVDNEYGSATAQYELAADYIQAHLGPDSPLMAENLKLRAMDLREQAEARAKVLEDQAKDILAKAVWSKR